LLAHFLASDYFIPELLHACVKVWNAGMMDYLTCWIALGGGLPNAGLFPFKALSFTLPNDEQLHLSPDELAEALQYSPTVITHSREHAVNITRV